MKQAVADVLNRLPIFVIIVCSGIMIYVATSVAKIAFVQLDPIYAVWYRVGFMTLLLLAWRRPWTRAKRENLPRTARQWLIVSIAGLSITAMNTAFYIAISNMNIGIAVAIEFVGPLTVAVLTGRSWRERLGIAIAASGVVLLAGISLQGPQGGSFLIGLIAILCGGSMWGVYIVTGRRIANRGNPVDTLSVAMTIGWLVQSVFLAAPAIGHVIHPKDTATWALAPGGSYAVLGLMFVVALFASFIPALIDQVIMRRASAATFSVMQSVYPATAVAVGLAFGEVPTPVELLGVSLVIIAVIVTFSGDKHPA